MKKFVAMAAAMFLLIMALGTSALAAADTPWTNDNIKIQVVENFSAVEDAVWNVTDWSNGLNGKGNTSWEVKDHALAVKLIEGQTDDSDWPLLNVPNYADFTAKADGFGYYLEVKQNSAVGISGSFWMQGEGDEGFFGADIKTGYTAVLTELNGKQTVLTAPEGWTTIEIPAGFKGFITIAFDQIVYNQWAEGLAGETFDPTEKSIAKFGVSLFHLTTDGVILDDFFVYGSGDDFTASENASEILDKVTKEPDQEPPKDEGDLSVLLYGAAALAGCGALSFRKKR